MTNTTPMTAARAAAMAVYDESDFFSLDCLALTGVGASVIKIGLVQMMFLSYEYKEYIFYLPNERKTKIKKKLPVHNGMWSRFHFPLDRHVISVMSSSFFTVPLAQENVQDLSCSRLHSGPRSTSGRLSGHFTGDEIVSTEKHVQIPNNK